MSRNVDIVVAAGRLPIRDRWVVGVFSDREAELRRLGAPGERAARELLARPGFKAGEGKVVEQHLSGGKRTLVLVGLGKASAWTEEGVGKFLDRAARGAIDAGDRTLAILLPEHERLADEAAAERAARQLALSTYRFDRFKSKGESPKLVEVTLAPPAAWRRRYERGAEAAAATAAGVALARDLANTPPNEATPLWMARQATALARRWGAKISVLGPPELRRRGMGGILAVGGGSENEPRMLRIELGRGSRTVALVGKGVTFDTGGISIKPAAQMDEMKWDKCGACAVLGTLEALARLKPDLRIRAYIPLAENMPDGRAYRPGDIVRCANGKTVEILNTDAEGRMILADALSWAASEKPDEIIEYSTLTGACVVALGHTGAGLFTTSDELAAELLAAAGAAGERLWRLPLWPEFLEEMKGSHADLKNSGGRWGGACTAAAFLSQFMGATERWAHLDIAGPAYVGGDANPRRGATGFGVGLTVSWLRGSAAR
jgi:leucyl aminopeptidase